MNKLFTIFTILVLLILSVTADLVSAPKITFEALLIQAESNPLIVKRARQEAIKQGLPINILTFDKIMLDVKAIEDERIVYAVYNDLANPFKDGFVTFYEDAVKLFSPSTSRIDFGNGNIVDNASGLFNPVITSSSGAEKFLMVPDWTSDRVYLFNFVNGNLVDEAFIPPSNPQLQSPKHALQHFNGRQILVSDQISDLVQKFDTNGTYVGFFAPSTGVNTAILDNMRGIRFLSNRNLLVTVGSGPSLNTIQQFDTGGVSIGAFITGNISSPFDILLRQNDILISNFNGTNRISRFDNAGNFLSSFYTGSDFALPQQLYRLENGNILAAAFSTPSGLAVLDSTGVFKRLFTNVTGLRGVHILGNGRYMVTNGTGVHEIDSGNGSLVRTIVSGANFQYVSMYNPGMFVSTGNNSNASVSGFELYSNYPNPFNPVTKIKFNIPSDVKRSPRFAESGAGQTSDVKLIVYNVLGKEVTILVNNKLSAGSYEVEFDGSNLSSGIYFYKLETDNISAVRRMALIK